jgi:hypothetical protein
MGLKYKRYYVGGFVWTYALFGPDFPLRYGARHSGGTKNPYEHFFKEGHYAAGVLFNPETKRFKLLTHCYFYRVTPGRSPYDKIEKPKYDYNLHTDQLLCPPKIMSNLKACYGSAKAVNYDPKAMCEFYLNEAERACHV